MKLSRLVALALVVIVGALIGATVRAQSAENQVYQSRAFDVVMQHDGQRTTSYRLAITGPAPYTATLPVSALANGMITFPLAAGLPAVGTYSIVVTAIGDGGATPSDPFVCDVVALPAAPSKGVVGIVKH